MSDTTNNSRAKSSKSRRTHRTDEVQRQSSTSTTSGSHRSQLVDLVIENTEAEEQEQSRAQRETGSAWPERGALHLQYVLNPLPAEFSANIVFTEGLLANRSE